VNSVFKTINPQLDWFEHGHGFIMYDNRVEKTRIFKHDDGDGCIPEIAAENIPPETLETLMSMARQQLPENPFDVLPPTERQYFVEIARLANERFGYPE
jgi:hypothetical protein